MLMMGCLHAASPTHLKLRFAPSLLEDVAEDAVFRVFFGTSGYGVACGRLLGTAAGEKGH
jgi:hypothetical protein